MKRISVAGGCYKEFCSSPRVDEVYGSGGRAALALAQADVEVAWNYYCPENEKENVAIILSHPNLIHAPYSSHELISFCYFHPLSKPVFYPAEISPCSPIRVRDDNVLRFGFMESEAVVEAQKCVYDPQSPNKPVSFKANGSSAKELAIVLNAQEVLIYGQRSNETEAVKRLCQDENADIVLVKAGSEGCRVYIGGEYAETVPPYWSDKNYKIGTGDIFSAAFSYHWAIENLDVVKAADNASRCVAQYCESRMPCVEVDKCRTRYPVIQNKKGRVYLAGPFFTMSELWLIEEACIALKGLGVDVFSPYHHVGLGTPDKVVAPDIKGLEESTVILAMFDGGDPGTMFEIGYAVKNGLPIVAFSQHAKVTDKTMVLGSPNCFFTDDFSTAIYHAAWKARE